MTITHEEAVKRSINLRSKLFTRVGNPSLSEIEESIAAAIEQAVKETAEECARMVYERSAAEPGEMCDEILAAFGISEVKRGKQNDSHSPSRSPEECGVSGAKPPFRHEWLPIKKTAKIMASRLGHTLAAFEGPHRDVKTALCVSCLGCCWIAYSPSRGYSAGGRLLKYSCGTPEAAGLAVIAVQSPANGEESTDGAQGAI